MKLFRKQLKPPQFNVLKKPKTDIELLQEKISALTRDVQFLATKLNKLTKIKCYNCKKVLVPDLNPIYTNFKGQKFCSHECIDAKEKN